MVNLFMVSFFKTAVQSHLLSKAILLCNCDYQKVQNYFEANTGSVIKMTFPLLACDPGKLYSKSIESPAYIAQHVSPDSQTDGQSTARIRYSPRH